MYGKNLYQGKFTPKNPKKYKGNPKDIVYRSSWELQLMVILDSEPNVIKWSSEEVVIPYVSPVDGKPHRYFMDFWVMTKNRRTGEVNETLIEVKPKKFLSPPAERKRKTKKYLEEVRYFAVNQAKFEAAKRYAEKRGMKFTIMTEDHLKNGRR
jgi:hypothetical protein